MRGKVSSRIEGVATISLALDERTWSAIDAIGVAEEGHLEFFRLHDKTSGDIWQDEYFLPVEIPIGHVVQAEVDIINDSSYDLAGTLTVEFIDPDGNSRGKRSFSYSAISPGDQRGVTTNEVTLDKDGTWKIHAKFEI